MSITVEINDKVEFSLYSTKQNKKVSNSDFAGKKLVIFFYPKDNTPGCTIEAKAFSDLAGEFAAADCVVLGVSKDNSKSHQKFIDKCNLKIDLLVDENGDFANKLGIFKEKSMFGKKYMGIERTTFLLDAEHKVIKIWPKVVPIGHATSVLKELS